MNEKTVEKVASRFAFKIAARPIPVDDREIDKIADSLIRGLKDTFKRLRSRYSAWDKLDDNLKFNHSFSVTGVDGKNPKFIVQVISRDISSDKYVTGGSTAERGNYHLITLQLNGSFSLGDWLKVYIEMPKMKKQLVSILKHEVTHMLDYELTPGSGGRNRTVKERRNLKPGEIPTTEEIDKDEYYNDPYEVRARMQDIVDEVKRGFDKVVMRSRDFNSALRKSLSGSETFQKMEPYLERRNRKKILDAIYREVHDFYMENYEGIFEL